MNDSSPRRTVFVATSSDGRGAEFTHYPVSPLLALPYPVRNVLRRWRGMVGMMLGVGIALSLVTTLLAVSRASIELYTGDYRKSGANLYVATHGGTLVPILPGDTPGTIEHARHVLGQIRRIPQVRAAVAVMSWSMVRERPGPRRPDEPTELVASLGVDGDPGEIPRMLVLQEGRWLRRGSEAVIGARFSREKRVGLGDTLRLAGRDFTIVGIGKLRGFGFSADSLVYLDYAAFRQRAGLGDVLSVIAVDATEPTQVRARIDELGRTSDGSTLSVTDVPSLVRQAEAANQSAVAIRLIFSVLTWTVGALFVSSMLSRSVAERRLEFATLRAIGVPARLILVTVGAEAALISVAASALGIGISLLFGALINGYLAPSYGFESLFSADAALFLQVMALALALAIAAGLLPAREATRVDPVDVLREA